MKHKKNFSKHGFTLIELLVVVAIIALLSSVALIAYTNARQKARDAKRQGDMAQMSTAMNLFIAENRGYPPDANNDGLPDNMGNFASTLPTAPNPADGSCDVVNPVTNKPANQYYYIPLPVGGGYTGANGTTVYPDFAYYFCIGTQVGNLPPGIHYLTSSGFR